VVLPYAASLQELQETLSSKAEPLAGSGQVRRVVWEYGSAGWGPVLWLCLLC
jgi:hypothetical protein